MTFSAVKIDGSPVTISRVEEVVATATTVKVTSRDEACEPAIQEFSDVDTWEVA